MNTVSPLFADLSDNACKAYRNIHAASNRHTEAGRQHCEDLWRDFAVWADDEFLTEFPSRFHERWFEMYLAVALKRAGLKVDCPKPGPDVLLRVGNRRIWIEAVCAGLGESGHPDAVPETSEMRKGEMSGQTKMPTDRIVLRLTSSLDEKARKYKHYLKEGIVTRDDTLIIALNVRAVPDAWIDIDRFMRKALYGVGNEVLVMNIDTGDIIRSENEQIVAVSKLATGQDIGVQSFIDSSMKHITGVLGSQADAVNLPARLGDDLHFFPNLTAMTPWTEGTIQLGEEWRFVDDEGTWQGQRHSHIQGK